MIRICGNTHMIFRVVSKYKNVFCTNVNTLMEENARVEHAPSNVLVNHLADGDVVDNRSNITRRTVAVMVNKAT
jgi:hypothetical protein